MPVSPKRSGGPRPLSFAEKVDRLFTMVHPRGEREWSYREVARAMTEAGTPVSANYLCQLRTGVRVNPTLRHVEGLAKFFAVPVSYFFDESFGELGPREMELLAAVRDAHVRALAIRAAGLSARSVKAVAGVVDELRRAEGADAGGRRAAG